MTTLTASQANRLNFRLFSSGLTAYGAADTFFGEAVTAFDLATGRAANQADTAGLVPFLWSDGTTVVATAGDPFAVRGANGNRQFAVTGATAVTDGAKLVYSTDEDATASTLTAPTDDRKSLGFVWKWLNNTTTTTLCEVNCFSAEMGYVYNMCGLHTDIVHLHARPASSGAYIYGGAAAGHRLVGEGVVAAVSALLAVPQAAAEAAIDVVVTSKINGTSATGTVTLDGDSAAAFGYNVARTALSGSNTFSDGDFLSIHASDAFSGLCVFDFMYEIVHSR